jgi:NAD(P)-dependent dehydrogenase (short-subunit alcohol dehydrogenase family)
MCISNHMKNAVLLTGASTGIGNATAQLLASSGYNVFAGVRSIKDSDALNAYGLATLHPILLDVTQKADIDTAFLRIEETVGSEGLLAVINNAGINYIAPFELSDEAKVRQVMEINVFGLINISQRFLPLLQKYQMQQTSSNTAKIINIGSIGSTIGIPWESSYHASKFAVLGLSESLRFELEDLGILITCVLPGGIRTPFFAKTGESIEAAKQKLSGANSDYYAGNLSKMQEAAQQFERFSTPPEKVAAVIERAIRSHRPPLKILVGNDAKIIYFLTKMGWTGLLKSQFIKPKTAR